MGKVKDLLWEPKDFEVLMDNDPARDYHEAIASLKAIVSTHLSCNDEADKKLIWRINEMINTLEQRL